MGADIYLQSIYRPNYEAAWPAFDVAVKRRDSFPHGSADAKAAQAAVDEAYEAMQRHGYFRDSYNSTSLFSFLGVSWWQSFGDAQGAGWSIDDDGRMRVPSMTALHDWLRDRGEVTCDQMQAWKAEVMPDRDMPTDPDDDESLTAWGRYFERKRRRLIKLLEQAIALGEPLECSC